MQDESVGEIHISRTQRAEIEEDSFFPLRLMLACFGIRCWTPLSYLPRYLKWLLLRALFRPPLSEGFGLRSYGGCEDRVPDLELGAGKVYMIECLTFST